MADDVTLLPLARRFAEQAHMAALTRLIGRPDALAKRKARIAAIRAHSADLSPEVQASMIVLRLAANGQLTDSLLQPSVTTRSAGGASNSGPDVKSENECRAPP